MVGSGLYLKGMGVTTLEEHEMTRHFDRQLGRKVALGGQELKY